MGSCNHVSLKSIFVSCVFMSFDFCEEQATHPPAEKKETAEKIKNYATPCLISVGYVFLEVHPDACDVAALSSNAAVKLRVQKKRIKIVVDEGRKQRLLEERRLAELPQRTKSTSTTPSNFDVESRLPKDSSDPRPSKK